MAKHHHTEREKGHTERGHSGSHTRTRSSGSPRHTETVGPGPVPGAGEYQAKGPGSSMETRRGMSDDMYPSEKTPKAPKGVKNHTRGQEEDE